MKILFEDFIKQNPIYQKFLTNLEAKYIFEKILATDYNIIAMIDNTSNQKKPALSACVNEVETYYNNQSKSTFSLEDNFVKQCIGSMVKCILEPFGYLSTTQKSMPKSCNIQYIGSAMAYEKLGLATMQIVKRIEKIE